MSCFCYLHIFPNEKIYVGTTQLKKPERRWKYGGSGYKRQPHLWNAIQKYGWENVKHKVIVCETPEEMWEMEKKLIKEYDTTNPEHGYNHSIGGEKGASGFHPTDETKRKHSELMKGEKNPSKRPEVRKKISESKKGFSYTDESRRKMSESHKGRIFTDIHRQRLSEGQKGEKNHNYKKHFTEDIRRKMSESHKGKHNGPKTRYKYLTPDGEIIEMSVNMASRWHPDWILIQNQE